MTNRRIHASDLPYNVPMPIPPEIQGQKYISLTTFRKSGAAVATPVWFGEQDDKLYVMTRSDSGKYKRIRNNPSRRLATCPPDDRKEVLAGANFVSLEQEERLHRDRWLHVAFIISSRKGLESASANGLSTSGISPRPHLLPFSFPVNILCSWPRILFSRIFIPSRRQDGNKSRN